jgi:hypothetical protein
MDDEDPSTNGKNIMVVISSSIIKQVPIYGLPSSMILRKKIIYKAKIRIDQEYIQYIQKQGQES